MTFTHKIMLCIIAAGWLGFSLTASSRVFVVIPQELPQQTPRPLTKGSLLPTPTPISSPIPLSTTSKKSMKPTPTPSPTKSSEPAPFIYNVSVGTSTPIFGFSLIQPNFQIQASNSGKIAAGAESHILKGYPGVTATGAFGLGVSLHYYSDEAYSGWWGKLGLGIYGIRAKILQGNSVRNFTFKSPTIHFTFGYRLKFKSGLNVGVSTGVYYFDRWSKVPGSNFRGILPIFTLDLGYSFNF